MRERGRREEGEGGERGREVGGGEPGRKRRGEERRNREELGAERDTQKQRNWDRVEEGRGKRGRGEETRPSGKICGGPTAGCRRPGKLGLLGLGGRRLGSELGI